MSAAPERRSSAVPSGLPIVSTEPLSFAERECLRELRRRHANALGRIDELLEPGARVDQALASLNYIAAGTDGVALWIARRLGRNR